MPLDVLFVQAADTVKHRARPASPEHAAIDLENGGLCPECPGHKGPIRDMGIDQRKIPLIDRDRRIPAQNHSFGIDSVHEDIEPQGMAEIAGILAFAIRLETAMTAPVICVNYRNHYSK